LGKSDDRPWDLAPGAFDREDESDDCAFYKTDRFVDHLDSTALKQIEELIGSLIIEESPAILDLMASWDSHLPSSVKASDVVGLGLNENELKKNGALTRCVIHDLNADPKLPFPDEAFDVVLCTVSVDYMTRPADVFRDVGRVLKPGGLYLVIFSNRYFPPKVVRMWREAGEDERVIIVEELFRACGAFEAPLTFVSRGRPRPENDKYSGLGIPSDPVYAVYADKLGGESGRRRPVPMRAFDEPAAGGTEERKKNVGTTLRCPYCEAKLDKWAVPQTPFTEWPNDFFYVCFNDKCEYFIRGWDSMSAQGNTGSYRFMYNHLKGTIHPLPVPSYGAFKDGIIDD
jgi:SAM-dependent methyltransferase